MKFIGQPRDALMWVVTAGGLITFGKYIAVAGAFLVAFAATPKGVGTILLVLVVMCASILVLLLRK